MYIQYVYEPGYMYVGSKTFLCCFFFQICFAENDCVIYVVN